MKKHHILLHQERRVLAHFYKYKYYFLLLPSAAATFLLLIINIDFDINFQTHDIHLYPSYKYDDVNETEYFIKTRGCTIPAFEPFDQSVVRFVHSEEPIQCHNDTTPPLVESDHRSIWVVQKYLSNYSIQDVKKLSCLYTPFYRQSSAVDAKDDRFEYKKESVAFFNKTDINYEYIKVECQYKKQLVYKDFHCFVIKNISKHINTVEKLANKYNVLILGIDAVSRMNFHRTMPLTLKFLQDSDAIEFKGYNKVGDNTYPNLIPVLSGLSEKELTNACYPEKNSTFDDCPFIWKRYDEAGYHTAYAEDAAPISLFSYFKNGFVDTPTDYYWRTFAYLVDREIGHVKQMNANLCLGPRLSVDVLLNYVRKFVKSMAESPFFGFFWETSLTHDFLNYPLLGDEKYAFLLESLKYEGALNSTVLILMSDHGIRWGDIRTTHQGHIEERLPFLFFVLPKSFKENYPFAIYNMKKNTRRLTTPFDLHQTLLDILNIKEISNEKVQQKSSDKKHTDARGISLFLPVPENRTCQSAAIEPHWCTCHQTRKLSLNDSLPFKIANIVINHMNNLLINYVQCAKLNLSKIIDLTVGEPSYAINMKDVNHIVLDYTIILQTSPGQGVFEATVRNTSSGWNTTGAMSRINLYGKQSACVDDFHLKLYCYCDNYLPP